MTASTTCTTAATSVIDKIFADWDRPDAPGLAVGVVRDGEALYTRGVGLANVEHRVPITGSTVFDIASMTKQFTAFAVLLLVRDGKLGLDDDVRRYLPDLPAYDPPVRVRHCLYHTSGLTDWLETFELTGPSADYCTLQRVSRTLTAMRETMFPAGAAHSYSNTGYVLLDWIVGRVAGQPMPAFLEERVFAPLGMARAAFLSYPEDFFPDQAQGYYRDEDGRLCRVSWSCDVRGDGRMFACIDDMVRWLRNFTETVVGDDALFERFFAPGQLDDGQPLRYAAGWVLDRYHGFQAIRHGGIGPGFQSHIAWFPEAGIGVTILGNLFPCMPWPLANRVLDVLVDERREEQPPSPPPDAFSQNACPEHHDLCGRYFTATGTPVLVDRQGERLMIETWYERRQFAMQSADRFRGDGYGDTVVFHRNASGIVTHLTLETGDGACPHMHSPIREAVKFEATVLDRQELAPFAGRYFSDELDTVYTVVADGDGLTARHLRCHDWHLHPITSCATGRFDSDFAQASNWPGKVTFERDPSGDVAGFRVRGTRVNLFFRRLSPVLS